MINFGPIPSALAGTTKPAPKRVPIGDIKRAVCARFDVPPAAMRCPVRSRWLARPRQVAMYLAREFSGRSTPFIGRQFGNRDHTTVLHACRTVERLAKVEYEFALVVADLRRLLTEHAARLAEHPPRIDAVPILVTIVGQPIPLALQPIPKRRPVAEIIGRLCRIQRCNRAANDKEYYCHRHSPRRRPMVEGWTSVSSMHAMMGGK